MNNNTILENQIRSLQQRLLTIENKPIPPHNHKRYATKEQVLEDIADLNERIEDLIEIDSNIAEEVEKKIKGTEKSLLDKVTKRIGTVVNTILDIVKPEIKKESEKLMSEIAITEVAVKKDLKEVKKDLSGKITQTNNGVLKLSNSYKEDLKTLKEDLKAIHQKIKDTKPTIIQNVVKEENFKLENDSSFKSLSETVDKLSKRKPKKQKIDINELDLAINMLYGALAKLNHRHKISDVVGLQEILNNSVPYVGANQDVDLGDQNLKTNKLELDTTPILGTLSQGQLYWDETNHTASLNLNADVNLQIGQEVQIYVRNNSGATITNGSVVYQTGVIGGHPTIAKAIATSESTTYPLAVATQDIANNDWGYCTTFGKVRDLNTNAYNENDELFLSDSVAGTFTTTPPVSPNYVVKIGSVTVKNGGSGEILVNIHNPLSNSNSLGTSQKLGATQNSIKSYVDTSLSSYTLGPASSTDNAVVRFDGVTGKLIQNSTATLSDAGGLTVSTIILNSGTATTLIGLNASKQIITLPTSSYPSFLELTYVKGVTSSIQTQLNGKQASLGYTPEDVANKSILTTLGTSDILYPTQNAVKSYVDTNLGNYLKLDASNDPIIGTLTVQNSADAIELITKGSVGQTANLQEWQDSSGTILSSLTAAGNFLTKQIGANTTPSATEQLISLSSSATVVSIVAKGATSQTADLQQWQNVSGTALAHVTSAGGFYGVRFRAGANSAVVGNFGLQNNQGIYSRNAANSGDVLMMKLNASNTIEFGTGFSLGNQAITGVYSISQFTSSNWSLNNTGTAWFGSNVSIGQSSAPTTERLRVVPSSAIVGIAVKADPSQTADLQQWQNSATTVLARVDKDGGAVFNENGTSTGDFRVEGDTDTNLLFADASADNVGIGTNSPSAKLHVNGAIKVATYERHKQLRADLTGNPASQPTPVDFFTASGMQFASTGSEYVYCEWEIPSDWDGTDIYFEVDWFPDSGAMSGTDTIKWDVEYRSLSEGELINNGTSVTVSTTDSSDYAQYQTKHARHTIVFNNVNQPLTAQDHIYFKISRDTSVANDFAGTVTVPAFEIVYNSTTIPTN